MLKFPLGCEIVDWLRLLFCIRWLQISIAFTGHWWQPKYILHNFCLILCFFYEWYTSFLEGEPWSTEIRRVGIFTDRGWIRISDLHVETPPNHPFDHCRSIRTAGISQTTAVSAKFWEYILLISYPSRLPHSDRFKLNAYHCKMEIRRTSITHRKWSDKQGQKWIPLYVPEILNAYWIIIESKKSLVIAETLYVANNSNTMGIWFLGFKFLHFPQSYGVSQI